jgi:Histidine kinase-, DNA gyrase B-, and HSP90-like ATPase
VAGEAYPLLRKRRVPDVGNACDIPALFEPFRRYAAHRPASSQSTGLGLSIVTAVARAHDGDVHAESRDGGGLIVTVTLPGSDPALLADTRGWMSRLVTSPRGALMWSPRAA